MAGEQERPEGVDSVTLERSQSSVEIVRDAKGSVKCTVKAYADDVETAAEEAFDTFTNLTKKLGV